MNPKPPLLEVATGRSRAGFPDTLLDAIDERGTNDDLDLKLDPAQVAIIGGIAQVEQESSDAPAEPGPRLGRGPPPKYLNTAESPVFTKGSHLYGLAENMQPLAGGALARAYELLAALRADPHGANLPDGLDPAELAERTGPAALVERLAAAEPLARQVATHTITDCDLPGPRPG